MDANEIQARADANLFETFGAIAGAVEGGEVRQADGVIMAASGLSVSAFNIAFVTSPLAEPAKVLAEVARYFDGRKLPFIVRVREGLDPRTEAAAEVAGMPFSDAVPGMVLEDMGRRGPTVEGLTIRTAGGEPELDDHARVAAQAFGMPLEAARSLMAVGRLHLPGIEFYVGYDEGRPVAASALFLSHDVAGVYNVATVPALRGRGMGEAMTWHAIRRGAERGALFASLQASEMGKPIYERMGFRTTTWYRTFHRPG